MAADANAQWKPRVNPWLIAGTVALAAFMEVLDTSIANVALPHIAGNLGASDGPGDLGADERTWFRMQSSCRSACVGVVGDRASATSFMLLHCVIFTISSFLCGIAPSASDPADLRGSSRVSAAAGLQPMAQAIMADSFEPKKRRGQAFALYGLVAVLAPSIGPTHRRGWITDNYSLALDLLHQHSGGRAWRCVHGDAGVVRGSAVDQGGPHQSSSSWTISGWGC